MVTGSVPFCKRVQFIPGWGCPADLRFRGISGQRPGLACSADLLPGREGPKASSANTLVADWAANTFLVDALYCSDKAGMEEIKGSGLVPEARQEFSLLKEARSGTYC